jgi:hypothetical protein
MPCRALPLAPLLVALASLAACAARPAHPDRPDGRVAPPASSAAASAAAAPPLPAMEHISELDSVTHDEADPKALELFRQRMAQAAVPLAAVSSPPRVTAEPLDDTSLGAAPGMKPDGGIFAATLAEGQRTAKAVTIAPGQCVTYIAQGGLGVIEVDLFLTTGEGASARVLAEDPGTGPIGVIGGRGRCFSSPTPVEGVLHAALRRGSGLVLLQAFRK